MAIKTIITSGKGGVGKSTVTALLGAWLGDLGKKVIIIEWDFGLRALDIILGVQENTVFDLNDVLTGRCSLDKAIIKCSNYNNLSLISSPLSEFYYINEGHLKQLFNGLSGKYDHILIDSPAGIGPDFRATLNIVDKAILIATTDPVCIRDGCRVSQILEDHGVLEQRLVINKVNSKGIKKGIFPDLDEVIDGIGVKLIAVIPNDDDILKYTATGKKLNKGSKSNKIFKNLAGRFIGYNIPLYIK